MIAPLVVLLLAGAASSGSDVVARVDAIAITRADVEERVRVLGARGHLPTPAEALGGLVDEALLATEARRQGLDRDPVVAEAVAAQRRRLLADALAADIAAKVQPTEAMLRQLYHSSGDSIRLVLVKLASREEAAAALERANAGGDLAEEARRALDPALARSSGDTGTLSRGQLDPGLADAAFRAPLGALIGPVELKLGWAVARVTERTISDEAGFAARRDALASFARRQLAAQSRQHVAEQLRARHAVKVDEGFLKSLGSRTDATPQELEHVIGTVNGNPIRYRVIHATIAQLAGGGGHLAGPSTKISLAQKAVEEHLFEAAALEKGLASAPAVTGMLPAVERNILASALVARTAANPAAGASDPKIRAKLGELRSRAKIHVDAATLGTAAAPRR